jgi:RND family efflux transporter MFP subunit
MILEQALNNLPAHDNQQLLPVVQLLAAGLEHEEYHSAATAVVTKIAELMRCCSVSYGSYENNQCTLIASSQSASIDQRMNLTRAVTDAMQEAINQDTTIVVPQNKSRQVVRAHAELLRQAKTSAICTLPVNHNGKLVGAFLLERQIDATFDKESISVCELIAGLVGPVLHSKYLEERSLTSRFAEQIKTSQQSLLGPQHATLKLASIVVTVAAVLSMVFSGEYRVTADAALEGLVERVVITPMDGYILEAHVRAGDEVSKGDLLAVLDDKDLQLERSRWFSEQQQIQRSYRAALSEQDRTQVVILKARLDQVTAKLELAEERLGRTRITAPLNGFIVSGDLSKSLGAPVERGEVLFEVMPMTDYRVILKVDERTIGQITESQRGTLALNGFPSERFAFEITRITPVSQAEDGNNYFLVEARLDTVSHLLRPGMQGVAKIDAGEQRLGWILTHEIVDWLRLWVWA